MTVPQTGASSAVRILLIEDEPAVTAFLRSALERSGYEVVPSASAAGGLRLLESQDFHGVVSDYRTPGGLSGADVHGWLERHRPALAKRIVFITGDIASDETLRTLAQAGIPCIEKPFRAQQLLAVVEQTIGKP